jgi:hypothetical protein
MRISKEEFALWVNNVIAGDKLDNEQIKLPNGYYVTMSARCKCAYLKKGINYYGDYDFWRYGSTDSLIDEMWLDITNALTHDNDEPYCKAGRVELSYVECDRIARHRQMIVAYRDIYRLQWSNAQGRYYATKMYHYDGELGLTKRGRWQTMKVEEINRMLGFDLFVTETIVKQKVMEAMKRLESAQPA